MVFMPENFLIAKSFIVNATLWEKGLAFCRVFHIKTYLSYYFLGIKFSSD